MKNACDCGYTVATAPQLKVVSKFCLILATKILYKQRELDYCTATSPLIYTGIIQLVSLLVSLFARSQVGVLQKATVEDITNTVLDYEVIVVNVC